jgi:hypothetical protein
MRRFGLVLVFLSLMISAVAACGGEASSEVGADPIATSAVVPTFIRVTVTPVPIDTPEPTATAVPAFTAEQLADPVFPDWLDPELNAEQPEDDVVFEGWQDYLTNSVVEFTDSARSKQRVNFCADGVVVNYEGVLDEFATWGATRTAAMSSTEWGKIAITATFQDSGRTFTFVVVSREGGKVMQTGWGTPIEMNITRSRTCLEMFPPSS